MNSPEQTAREIVGAADDDPIIKLCDALCWEATKRGWDLFHIESDGHIRSQTNGVWREEMTPPPKMVPRIVRRFKVIAQLDMIHNPPEQAGSARFLVNGTPFEINVRVRRAGSGEESALIEFVHPAA